MDSERTNGSPRKGLPAVAAILAALSLSGCFLPLGLSDQCKTQISECLKDCPQPPPRANDGFSTGAPNDWENTGVHDATAICEEHCYKLCDK